jgi:O-antigen/teichoic acid export membrane protein
MAGLASVAITAPLLARHLGADLYGRFVIAVTVGFVVATVADLGLPLLASRDWPGLAADRRSRWLADFWSIRLWSTAVVTASGVVVVAAMSLDAEMTAALTVGLLAVPVMLLSSATSALFLARLNPWPGVWSEVVSRLIWVGGVVVAVATDAGMVAILGLLIASQALGLAVLVAPGVRLGLISAPRLRAGAVTLGRRAAPLAVIPVLGVVYARADTLVVAALATDAETGMYGAMWRLVEVIISVPVIGSTLLLPLLSRTGDRDVQRRQYVRATRLLMVGLVPAAAAIAVVASPLLELFGGSGFFIDVNTPWGVVSPSTTLVVLMGGVVLMGFGILNGAVMVATHRQRALIRQSVLVVVVNLALALALIPRLSILGAAIAVLVTEVLSFAHSTWVVRGALGRFAMWDVVAWPTMAATALVAVMVALSALPAPLRAAAGGAAALIVIARSPVWGELGRLRRAPAEVAS